VKNTERKPVASLDNIQADSLYYQGELLLSNDDVKKALIYFKAAERMARSGASHNIVLSCLERQTTIHLRMKNPDLAASKAREGLAYARLLERVDDELSFLLRYSRALRQGNRQEEAMGAIFEGLELSSDAKYMQREKEFVVEMAEISLELNDTKGALLQATSLLRRALLLNNMIEVSDLAALVDRISSHPETPATV
jgi:tetratricopeptide (TPR) repeat protein